MEQNLFNDYPDIVSITEMMTMLHIGKVLAYKLIAEKKIEARKVGRDYKIPKRNIIKFVLEG